MGLAKEYIRRLNGPEKGALISAIRLRFHDYRISKNTVRDYYELREVLVDLCDWLARSIDLKLDAGQIWEQLEYASRRRGGMEGWLAIAADPTIGGLHAVLVDVLKAFEDWIVAVREKYLLSEISPDDLEKRVEICAELVASWGHLIPGPLKTPAELASRCTEVLSQVARNLKNLEGDFKKY